MDFREINDASLLRMQAIINTVAYEVCDRALYFYMTGGDTTDDSSVPSNPTTLYQKAQMVNYLKEELDKLYKDIPSNFVGNAADGDFVNHTLVNIAKIKTVLSAINVLVAHMHHDSITYDDYDYILRMKQLDRDKVCIMMNLSTRISNAEVKQAIPVLWHRCCLHIADLIKKIPNNVELLEFEKFNLFDENHIKTVAEVMKLCRKVYNEIS